MIAEPPMKETVLDVLMYLSDNYSEEIGEMDTRQDALRKSLRHAGFADGQIDRAFAWLDELVAQHDPDGSDALESSRSFRVYSEAEAGRLDADCRGFMLHLEQTGVLGADERERIMDRVMALDMDEMSLAELKWIVLMVMFNRPGSEADFNWKEGIVMDDACPGFH